MDIETTLNKCDFGEAIGDECHKLSYTRIQNMENLRDYSEDVQETLLMRAGIQHQPDKANMTICTHHSKKFGRVFERTNVVIFSIRIKSKQRVAILLPFILQSN